jgi:hypothetical protein
LDGKELQQLQSIGGLVMATASPRFGVCARCHGGNRMSEMSASMNVEAGSTASDSGTGPSAEAGMSGPAEAGDQAGARSAANDNIPQAANDNVAQAEPASDASTEATGDFAASY